MDCEWTHVFKIGREISFDAVFGHDDFSMTTTDLVTHEFGVVFRFEYVVHEDVLIWRAERIGRRRANNVRMGGRRGQVGGDGDRFAHGLRRRLQAQLLVLGRVRITLIGVTAGRREVCGSCVMELSAAGRFAGLVSFTLGARVLIRTVTCITL